MSNELPTIRIKSDHPELPGYIVINESDFDPAKHERFDPAPLPPLPPLPPLLTVTDPLLANLPADWRERDDLKSLAAAVSGGRAVENKEQAVQVIEAALKARATA